MKLLPCILFEKYIYVLALEMASPGNQHCANCIGTLSFPKLYRIYLTGSSGLHLFVYIYTVLVS